jgi:hypothetical protein
MIILVVGLSVLAVFASGQAGGADKVLALAVSQDMFKFWPEPQLKDILFFFASAITIMLGSIPHLLQLAHLLLFAVIVNVDGPLRCRRTCCGPARSSTTSSATCSTGACMPGPIAKSTSAGGAR